MTGNRLKSILDFFFFFGLLEEEGLGKKLCSDLSNRWKKRTIASNDNKMKKERGRGALHCYVQNRE
jgi:hypothetical protein